MRLARDFYERPTLEVARDLIGAVLVHRRGATVTSGMIVEVEAYIGESDPACHAAPGLTRRNAPLYGMPGRAYVYLNYGIHSLMNAVTEPVGSPAAVLIRALDPIEGLSVMRRRRRRRGGARWAGRDAASVCRGPGNLAVAMGITLADNGRDLMGPRLFVEEGDGGVGPVGWGPRVGIRVGTDRPWRAHVLGHPAVSGPSREPAGARRRAART